jgi:hypothetical protein
VTSTFSSHPFWTWIRPRILGWVQEVYPDCLDQCTGPASRTSPGDSLGTMATNINWYLQHPARLAFSSTSNANPDTKTTLWQKYIPLENTFYGQAGRDNYDTAFSLVTMDRFARLQIYATRSWATATPNGQYPFRKIGFAWNNNATNQKLLAQELAHSVQGAYSLGATARFACTNTARSNISGVPNIGLCKPHLNGATLKPTWNAFGTW